MANVTITQLPTASALTGTEAVPVVQNGVTVQTTTGAIQATSNLSTYPFLMTQATGALGSSRYITTGAGMTTVDGGVGSTFAINLVGAPLALVTSGTGFQVKTGSTTLINRSVAVSGSGLSISNGSGISGDPTISLSGIMANFASVSGTGLLTVSGTVVSQTTITGTANSITITNGNASGGAPTIAIADNPVLTGTSGLTIPAGTTAQRSGSNGTLRYNTSTGTFEGYANGAWGAITTGTGVTSISTGTGLTGGPITSTGTISIADTGVSANTYGSASAVAVFTVNAQGQLTSASTTTISIPSSAINTLIPNASLTNSSVTIGTTSISLGATSLTLGGLTTVTVTQDPVSALQLATKQYVDNIAQGLDVKASVVNSSTANFTATYSNGTLGVGATLTNSSTLVAFSADGITNSVGDRVLIKNQSTSAQNGIYTVTTVGSASVAWVLTRATDMDVWAEVPSSFVFIETGSTLADTGWVCTSNAGGTMGTTAITWVQFSGSGSGVSSITFGSTGLTPSTTTTGAVTVAGTLSITNGGTGQTTASSAFNALSPITTTGDLIIGNGTNSSTRLGIGTNGYVLTSNGTTATWSASSGGVTSFTAGTTGLTPSSATTGAITLSGTLVVGNGGTGVATLTGLAYGNGTSAFTSATGAQVVSVIGSTAVTNATNSTNATNATNLALTSGSGATNYITFASSATGNQAINTSTGLTFNATNSTITSGISGGTF
jgi:hypothetical protein